MANIDFNEYARALGKRLGRNSSLARVKPEKEKDVFARIQHEVGLGSGPVQDFRMGPDIDAKIVARVDSHAATFPMNYTDVAPTLEELKKMSPWQRHVYGEQSGK